MSCVRKKYIPINEPIPVLPEVKVGKYSSPRVETLGSPSTFLNYLTNAYNLGGISDITSLFYGDILNTYPILKSQGKLLDVKFVDSELEELGFDVSKLITFFRKNMITRNDYKYYHDTEYSTIEFNGPDIRYTDISSNVSNIHFLIVNVLYGHTFGITSGYDNPPILGSSNLSFEEKKVEEARLLLWFAIFVNVHFPDYRNDMITSVLSIEASKNKPELYVFSYFVFEAYQKLFTRIDDLIGIDNLYIPIEHLIRFTAFKEATKMIKNQVMSTFKLILKFQVKHKFEYNERKDFQSFINVFRQQFNSMFEGKLHVIPNYPAYETNMNIDCKSLSEDTIIKYPARYWQCNPELVKNLHIHYIDDSTINRLILEHKYGGSLHDLYNEVIHLNGVDSFANSVARLAIKANRQLNDEQRINFISSLLKSFTQKYNSGIIAISQIEIISDLKLRDTPIFINLVKLLMYLIRSPEGHTGWFYTKLLIDIKAWDVIREQFNLLCTTITTLIKSKTYDKLDHTLRIFSEFIEILIDMNANDIGYNDVRNPSYQYMVRLIHADYNRVFNKLFQQESKLFVISIDQTEASFQLLQFQLLHKFKDKKVETAAFSGDLFGNLTRWKDNLSKFLIDNNQVEASDNLVELYNLMVSVVKTAGYESPDIESELETNIPAFYLWSGAVDKEIMPNQIIPSIARKLARFKSILSK